jgi:hypothetical protein
MAIVPAQAIQMLCDYLGCTVGRAEALLHRACVIDREVRWATPFHRADDDGKEWQYATVIDCDDLIAWVNRTFSPERPPAQTAAMPKPTKTSAQDAKKKAGRGRPPEYDFDEGWLYAEQLLNSKGDPRKPENQEADWRSGADLGRAVAAHIATPDGREPDLKHVMRVISPKIGKWRRSQQRRKNA